MLSKHVDYEKLIAQLQDKLPNNSTDYRINHHQHHAETNTGHLHSVEPIPKFHINEEGLDPEEAYNIIHGELELDGIPDLNLASFVNTRVSHYGEKLAQENLTKNLADTSEYPALMNIHQRCVNIISHLWNVPRGNTVVGCATTGSSEAVQLGGLAMKRLWEARQKKNGRPCDKPNIVMGANAQVALEKFARYFDVEGRMVPVSEKSRYCLDLDRVEEMLDENTIGIYVILGSTYTGHYEDVQAVNRLLDKYEEKTGHYIPIHVDGASGGFVAPFVHPSLEWDFRCPRVNSINVSGHKFGLSTAGVGWILWKDQKYLPDNLVFKLSYLGGVEESFTLNFSRPGHQIVQQYFMLVTLGRQGYANVHGGSLSNARLMSHFLEETGFFEVISDIHRPKGVFGPERIPASAAQTRGSNPEEYNFGLPVVAFKFSDDFEKEYPEIPQSSLSALLKLRGYIIPNYPLPPDAQKKEVLRVVVRSTMPTDMLDKLMEDIVRVTKQLMNAAEKHRSTADADRASAQYARAMLELVTAPEDGFDEHEASWELPEDHDPFHHNAPRYSKC